MLKIQKFVRDILLLFGLRISGDLKVYSLFKRNVFKSDSTKKVLLSYITEPFTLGLSYAHTNLRECYTAGEIFNELGYRVDVIDFSSTRRIDFSDYDVIYGMGAVLERSFYQNARPLVRIFYGTGCNPAFSNIQTILKVRSFKERHGPFLIDSSRIVPTSTDAQVLLSDAVIVLGNEFVLNTYRVNDPEGGNRYCRTDIFFNDAVDLDVQTKDFSVAKKHFLWFGSGGLLHKGLDVLIDIFLTRPDLTLHICGAPAREEGFFQFYNPYLSGSPNIVNHGFVKMESPEFLHLMQICGYTVFPSVSEGGAPAILNVMANGGLVPIVTRSTGVDLDTVGEVLETDSMAGFAEAIDHAAAAPEEVLKQRAVQAKQYVRENYSFDKYKSTLKSHITSVLKNKVIR